MSISDIQARITAGIRRATSKTGNSKPLTGVISKAVEPTVTSYPADASLTETGSHTHSVMFIDFTSGEKDRGLTRDKATIKLDDVKLLIMTDGTATPEAGDYIVVNSVKYRIMNVESVQVSATPMYWEAHCRPSA